MRWITHPDGGMHMDCTDEPSVKHVFVSFRHDSQVWIAFAAVQSAADIWLTHRDSEGT